MNIHILLFLIMNIKTDEYIAQERIQQEKIQHEQVKPEQAEQYNKAVPSKRKPIIQYKDSAPPPIRICNKGEISSDCRKLTQAEISGNVVRGKKQNIDDQTP